MIFFNASIVLKYNGVACDYVDSDGELVAKDMLKRLYSMSVELYPAGSDFTGAADYTLDASKVD